MADKVQKIREEVERLQSLAEYNFGISLTENARQFWLGESNVLTLIGKYIGTMQKEPIKIKKGCKYRCLSDMINRDTGNIAFIGDNIYFAPKDNTLVSEEYGLLCDTSEDASNFELVEEPKKCMYSKDDYTDEDRKTLCDGCEEECKFNKKEELVIEDILDMSRIDYRLQHNSIEDGIKYHAEEYSFNIESELFHQLTGEQQKLWRKELERAVISGGYCGLELSRDKRYKENQEPVSEDLEQAIDTYLATYFGGEKEKQEWPFLKKMAIHFAKWKEERLIANAVDVEVKVDAGGYPYIPQIELYDYDKDIPLAKGGDKYKVILIKEDLRWK